MIYKFVSHDIPPLETYANTAMYKLHQKLENEEELTREEKNRLYFTASDPVYKYMGYAYDFREWLTKFYVEDAHYIQKVYAWDRTAIREHWYGRIINIANYDKEN